MQPKAAKPAKATPAKPLMGKKDTSKPAGPGMVKFGFTPAGRKGKSVKKGHWEGKWTIVKGTGKFQGIIGGGTYSSYMLAPGQSYSEWEGEIEMPTQ